MEPLRRLDDKEKLEKLTIALQEARENLIKWTFTSPEERKKHENLIVDLQRMIKIVEDKQG